MKIVINDVVTSAYIHGAVTDVHLTIEIDTSRLEAVADRVLNSRMGEARWASGAILAFLTGVEQ